MDESFQYYRIQLTPHSNWRMAIYLSTWLGFAAALLIWPYVLPNYLPLFLLLITACAFVVMVKIEQKDTPPFLFLCDDGTLKIDSQGQSDFQISASSHVLFWNVKLALTESLSNSVKWIYIYRDQVKDSDYRRLKRIVYRMRKTAPIQTT